MMSQSQSTRTSTPQAQPIIIIAITLFAFSGLMVGFTVGAFTHNRQSANSGNPTIVASNHTPPTPTPAPSPTATVVLLGCPTLTNIPSNASGTQQYTANIQAEDKTGTNNGVCNIPQEKPVTADGITCRIWVESQDNDPNTELRTDPQAQTLLQNPATFNQQSFPHEKPGALNFDPGTPTEAQPCVKGAAQWKFTISPTLPKGNYFLVGLTDWQGQHWNWTSVQITVSTNNSGNNNNPHH